MVASPLINVNVNYLAYLVNTFTRKSVGYCNNGSIIYHALFTKVKNVLNIMYIESCSAHKSLYCAVMGIILLGLKLTTVE